MSFGIPVRNGLGIGIGNYATFFNNKQPAPPPPTVGVLSHTLLQIGMTAPG